ncbi:threonine/homoserine/homoserine lactone efflux protein [Novosphingobium kunmingense]|uniref:Threonine/homoserine/homoserine lactone efflux protein n=1 Tax=Novosphingobium kunmingense TaxID=1211806 RepID=A0A2N0H6Z3_9SPHN|nr:LysE family translocator [Novosphingobium kunmingense]PKB14696.1 threonine/homoserine/homoserine lactone efflux protein [Novosphingobium kunmingense]
MFDPALLAAFLFAATILTLTPGVDTAMVLRAATVEGRRPAMQAALGIALGCLIWGAAVAMGLGTLLRASELAYTIVKIAGAAYLVWLGIGLMLRPRRKIAADDPQVKAGQGNAFCRGLLTNLLNPKIGVFYVTFLPQFVPPGAPVGAPIFLLASIHVVLGLVWFAVLIAATVPLGRALRRPSTVAMLDRLTGAVFVAFGAKLALSR